MTHNMQEYEEQSFRPFSIEWWLHQKQLATARTLGAYNSSGRNSELFKRYWKLSCWIKERIVRKVKSLEEMRNK